MIAELLIEGSAPSNEVKDIVEAITKEGHVVKTIVTISKEIDGIKKIIAHQNLLKEVVRQLMNSQSFSTIDHSDISIRLSSQEAAERSGTIIIDDNADIPQEFMTAVDKKALKVAMIEEGKCFPGITIKPYKQSLTIKVKS